MDKLKPDFRALPESEKSRVLSNLNSIVLSELKPVSMGLAVLYLIFAFSHYFFLTDPLRIIMTMTAAITVFTFLILNLLLHKLTIRPENAHPIATIIAIIVIFNSILHLYLSGEPQQSTNLALLILGVGFLFLSTNWYGIILIISGTSWLIVAKVRSDTGNWIHFGFFMLSAIVLSGIIHIIRKQTRIRFELIRNLENQQREALKRTIDALELSKSKYKDLFENADDLIQSVNAEGKFEFVNRAWTDLLGYDEKDCETLFFLDTIRKDNREKCAQLFHEVQKGKISKNVRTVFVSKTGNEIYVEGSINPQIVNGKFIATRAIFRDITERIKAEEELKNLHEELKNVNERLKEAYTDVKFEKDVLQNVLQDEEIGFITDAKGTIIAVTEKARTITGKSRLELLNSLLPEIFDKQSKDAITEALRLANIKNFHSIKATLTGNKPTEIEYTVNFMKLNTIKEKQLLVILRIETEI